MPKSILPTALQPIVHDYVGDKEVDRILKKVNTMSDVLFLTEAGILIVNSKCLVVLAKKFQDAIPMGEDVAGDALCDFSKAGIESDEFGKNLDAAEFMFRLIHDVDFQIMDMKIKVDFMRQILNKTRLFVNQHAYNERYLDTRTMPLATHKFIFEVGVQYDPQLLAGEFPIMSSRKEVEKYLVQFSKFPAPLPMKIYIINRLAELSDQKPFQLTVRSLGASNSLFAAAPAFPGEQERDYDLIDLRGRRKPEEPLRLFPEEEFEQVRPAPSYGF